MTLVQRRMVRMLTSGKVHVKVGKRNSFSSGIGIWGINFGIRTN